MELNIDFFKIRNESSTQKGSILISEPFLSDNYFKRSIVLITEHSDEGSVGFVLNKQVDLKVQDVIQDFPEIDAGISIGGPVNTNTIHYIHTLGDIIPDSVKITNDIYWGGNFDVLKELVALGKIKKYDVRFFLGYAGWASKQLEGELSENAWLVSELSSEMIMKAENSNTWNQILEKMNNKYQVWANFPENPGLN
jgi:putative transcriptional regulator